MRLKTLSGREVSKNTAKYRISWEGKSLSKMQMSVKTYLRTFWEGDIVYEEFPVFGTKMRLDFFNASRLVAIEVNGDQHRKFTPYFHDNSLARYHFQIKRDYKKFEWCEVNAITLVEIYTEDFPLNKQLFMKQGVLL